MGNLSNFLKRSTSVIVSTLMVFAGLQVMESATAPAAHAATLEPYGLNYQNAYFNVSGGLVPGANNNYQLDTWFRINDFSNEPVVILGNSGATRALTVKVTSATNIYIGAAWVGSNTFVCGTPFAAGIWYQLTVVQDDSGQRAWVDGTGCGGQQARYASYAQATQVGGQSSPQRLTANSDIASLRFRNVPEVSSTSTTITPPSYPLANVTNTTFLLNASSVSSPMYDTTGKTLTPVYGSGLIRASQILLIAQTISFSQPTSMTYGAIDQTLTVSASSGLGIDLASSTPSICTIVSSKLHVVSPGTCTVTANQAGNATYSVAPQVSRTITISAAASSISVTGATSFTYDGSAQGPASASTVGSSGSVTYSYLGSGSTTYGPSATKPTNAGTYAATATIAADTNYLSATSGALGFVIAKAGSTISVTGLTAYTFNGSAQGPSTSIVTGSSGSVTYSYSGSGLTTYGPSATKPTNAGTYVATASLAATTNYSSATSTAYEFEISSINQAQALTITTTSTSYGTPLSLATSGGTGSGLVSFIADSGPCIVSGATLTATGAGTCMLTATKASDGNYLAASSTSTAITVARKNLTIVGLTGVNKEFDHGLTSSVTGTPSLFGVVGADDVLLDGTPVFTFATADVANGKTVTASGFTLAGTTADNYTLSQPTVTANITKKAARVVATDVTVAFGSTVSGAFTTSGLLGGDSVSTSAYTFSGTGTSSAPTAVGVYSITPSNAVFGSGSIGNYDITYAAAVLTILAKYTTTYNANGGLVSNGATSSVDFVVGDSALTLPSATRANFTFVGWFTQQTIGVQVTGTYTPIANATLWARWVQNSLYGIGSNTKILTITTLAGVGNTYSASAGGGTIAIEYLADALPAGTVIDAYVLADTTNAATVIGAGNNYVMSLVLAWLAPDGTVPTTATGKAISMTITNATIKRGAKIYAVIGSNSTLLGTATVDGSATVSITDDPQIFIAITRPDAPTGIMATSGVNAGSVITWSAPVSDGGSEITGYTVTSSTGETCVSVTTSCSMTGLTNGVAYTFTVTATNAIGTSTTSTASLTATPAAPVVNAPVSQPAPDTSAADRALAEAKAKALADAKAAAELKAAADLKAAAEAKALADAKAAADAAKANALNGKPQTPAVSLYSLSTSLKLNAYDTAYLKKYVSTLTASTTVTCTGYIYPSSASKAKAKSLAVSQATALCKTIKSYKPSLKTAIVTFDSKLAPKAAKGSKWVGVSYRVDGRTGA